MNPATQTSNSNCDFDKVNTMYSLTIHFKNQLVDYRDGKPMNKRNKDGVIVPRFDFPFCLKKINDPLYEKEVSELKRLFYLINLHRKSETNEIDSFALYENVSKGGTIKGLDNKDAWLFSVTYNYLNKVHRRSFARTLTEERKAYFNGIIDIIEDFNNPIHKKLRLELNLK